MDRNDTADVNHNLGRNGNHDGVDEKVRQLQSRSLPPLYHPSSARPQTAKKRNCRILTKTGESIKGFGGNQDDLNKELQLKW